MWIVLLDHSGSMGEPFTGKQEFAGRSKASTATIKLDAAKNALLEHILGFGSPSRFALIEFTSKANVIFDGSSDSFEVIQRVLDALHPDDGTDIAAALDKTLEYISTVTSEPVIRILVITDGLSNREHAEAAAKKLSMYGNIIDVILIDPTDEGELVGRAIALNGTVTGVTSAKQLSDTVAIARELERRQAEETATLLKTYEEEKIAVTGIVPSEERLSFTAGYPNAVLPGVFNSLLIYFYIAKLKSVVEKILQQQSAVLGFTPSISITQSTSSIKRETLLRFTPHLDNFTFYPPSYEVKWYEDIQEVRFRFRAETNMANRTILGSIDVYTGTLLIAQLPLSITVREHEEEEQTEPITVSAHIFNSIFASYSHKDAAIVQACAAAYRVLGISMYIDIDSLRSGERWKRVLLKFIDQSDVFQLYWSNTSSQSDYVRAEWEYALELRNVKGEQFVRPLYWEEPLPKPPPDLVPVHFAKLDLETLSRQVGRSLIFAEPQQPLQQQDQASQAFHVDIYATVLPTLSGTSEKIVAQVRDDVAFAITFLEETTGLRYYPAPTLLVDHYAVKSIREHSTVDLPPAHENQNDLAFALDDVIRSICLDFHTHSFYPKTIKVKNSAAIDDIANAFGKVRLLSNLQYDTIRRYCEADVSGWIRRFFAATPLWMHSRSNLVVQFPEIGNNFSDFVPNFLDQLMRMMHEKRANNISSPQNVTILRTLNTHFLPYNALGQAGITVTKSEVFEGWTELRGTEQAFIQGLQILKEGLKESLPASNNYSYVQAKNPDEVGQRSLTLGYVAGAICDDLIADQREQYSRMPQGRGQLTDVQRDLLVEQSKYVGNWIEEVIYPDWRQARNELLSLNLGQFSSDLNFIGFISTFFKTVYMLLQQGLQQFGTFWHESGYSIQQASWQLLQREIPVIQLRTLPDKYDYNHNKVCLCGEFSEFVRIFDISSERLVDILHRGFHLSSPTKRFFAIEVPTYGIYAPPNSLETHENLRQWAFEHGVATQFTLPQSPRVLLSLDAQSKFAEQLEQEVGNELERLELAALFQRCVILHEHFHAILEIGLDIHRTTAVGVQFGEAWRVAFGLNESLAAWMELHFARDKPDLMNVVQAYIHADQYPNWPYRGAEYIESLYQEWGIESIRELIANLRQDPKSTQAQFDASFMQYAEAKAM